MSMVKEKNSTRLHVESKLMGESLNSKSFIASLEEKPQFRAYPNISVLKIGGQSITDRGAKVLLPIIDEIAQNSKNHKMMISSGGGTRSRHVYAIALDLGMPTGIIAKLGASISEQNSLMIATLLAPYGGIKVGHDDIVKLAAYFNEDCIPVTHGMPPYHYFERPPEVGRIPPNRTDIGAFLLAEVLGAKQCIYIKDENGLYTDDPKKNPHASFISEIGARELLNRNQDDLVVERTLLESLCHSQGVKQIQIINGMKRGNITKALRGEHIGTIIFKDV